MQKRSLLAAFAAATIVATVPGVAFAQDPVPTPTPTPTPQQRTSAGDVAKAPNFGSLMSALNNAQAQTEKLAAKTELTAQNVQFVNVEELVPADSAQALESALTQNEAQITELRSKIAQHTALQSILSAATTTPATPTATATPITAEDVVAVDVQDDGQVIVYYKKKKA